MYWNKRKVLVTGGASFIGSHLVDLLVESGARVRVADDFSSGKRENLAAHVKAKSVEVLETDLLRTENCEKAVRGMQTVFHLAALHGGRGYVDLHQALCAQNFAMDGTVFKAAREGGVEKVVFASSGCVYPNYLQTDVSQELYLTESMVGPPYDADNLYGWAKLMSELTLRAYHQDFGMKSASLRFFTVYGRRGHENHAVIAMIAKAFVKMDPYPVWGTGEQIRNWTHVRDIVRGMALAGEKIEDGTAVNLGSMERIRVIECAREVLRYTKHKAEIRLEPDKPVGPLNRVADNAMARRLLGWEPQVKFMDGLHDTIDWYFSAKDRAAVKKVLQEKLTER
ncbi:MAG: GDP-L-fucose synthase 1 [Omnitrophica bacterium RIFCSPHIGHO2_02_FULL_63_14]|nr:MAG: GDP-L-fucose synthase 1 [Omnitrophica bacterium RIFCSPHIGHO2_02_FULL_63_14]